MEYLKDPLTRNDLERLIELLDIPPGELVRHDKYFRELQLQAEDYVSKKDVAELLLEHPRLMERPVAATETRAIIARPSEQIKQLI